MALTPLTPRRAGSIVQASELDAYRLAMAELENEKIPAGTAAWRSPMFTVTAVGRRSSQSHIVAMDDVPQIYVHRNIAFYDQLSLRVTLSRGVSATVVMTLRVINRHDPDSSLHHFEWPQPSRYREIRLLAGGRTIQLARGDSSTTTTKPPGASWSPDAGFNIGGAELIPNYLFDRAGVLGVPAAAGQDTSHPQHSEGLRRARVDSGIRAYLDATSLTSRINIWTQLYPDLPGYGEGDATRFFGDPLPTLLPTDGAVVIMGGAMQIEILPPIRRYLFVGSALRTLAPVAFSNGLVAHSGSAVIQRNIHTDTTTTPADTDFVTLGFLDSYFLKRD